MTTSPKQHDAESDVTVRERIDALLDEALMESFPASDSCAIGSGTTAIKQEYREGVSQEALATQARKRDTPSSDKRTP